jgi:hypothetical protein
MIRFGEEVGDIDVDLIARTDADDRSSVHRIEIFVWIVNGR